MRNLCSRCGADLAMVGRTHRCIPKSRDANVTVLAGTTRDAKPIGRSDEAKARKSEAVVGVARSLPSGARTTMASKKTGVGSERTKPDRQSIKGRAGAKRLGTRGPAPGYGGRPRKGDEGKTLMAKKPWEAEGVSMATWYRRKKEQKQ